ncbi:RagB/SusD family nutrient uptake outer membrane protein [Maribellus comscasis]|uniref:RagB/SusD family nutrient uptake outer membrane protein n=1 Tax=Maribellus comscasis TaxID=2681766 RepID=A0A6I6JTI9_9BACT|nr:RagB/SusD family nutrient uptake outer membrane protein [Maribellus comscasis]QGY43467.1 RagB/SusD family nutrient uptake outer membrane protein [Maribellus comscasis]
MKKIKYITIAIFSILFLGCSEDLDLYPLTQITEGTFYKNEVELQQAVDDVYRQLGILYNGDQIPARFGEQYSDNTYIELAGGANNYNEQITDFFIQTDNGLINTIWNNSYSTIYICNNILYQIENIEFDVDENKLEKMKGQAIFIRALTYFNMVRAWGDVPYIDKKISPKESYDYLRVDVETVYENIINDLLYCKQVLPEAWSGDDIGRVTQYGASAVLAKIYLTLGENDKSKTELDLIINSALYSLDANGDGNTNTDDFLYLFAADTKNCQSSVLEAQYMAGENAMNSNHQNQYSPFTWAFHLPGQTSTFRGTGIMTPTDDLENEFEENDPRKEVSINPGYIDNETGVFVDYPYTMKFYDPNWEYPGQNFEIIRYADILLMYAEVTNDQTYLNLVRSRVGMPAYGSDGYPSDKYPTLALAIEHERRIELCFEFHRFFDLKRTGRAIEIMASKGYNIDANKLLFPIPLNAIDVNPDLTQNPGYN